jgi:cysteine-rich repeat protein
LEKNIMKKSIFKNSLVALTLICSAGVLASCSGNEAVEGDGPSVEDSEEFGRLNMNLEVDGYQVDTIHYVISNSGGVVTEADADVSPDVALATAWVLLPPGSYTVELTSMANDTIPCAGEEDFTITAGGTSSVDVTLTCRLAGADPASGDAHINAEFEFEQLDACGLTHLFVGPIQTSADGGVITLESLGTPGLTYAWTVGGGSTGNGTFGDASMQNTLFTCTEQGTVNLTLTVTNEAELCTDQQVVAVACAGAPNCGNGTFEPLLGEECDSGLPAGSPTCTDACTLIECGDGLMEGLEECDDTNTVSEDGCSSLCELESCGDGVVQLGLGEECEPPGSATCDAACQDVVVVETCADCTATNCASQLAACTDPVNNGTLSSGVAGNRCTDVVSCFESSLCAQNQPDTSLCLCGTFSPLDCAGGDADGVCMAQLRRGAGTGGTNNASVLNTLLRFVDPAFSTGDANLLASCQANSCAASCPQY